MNGLIIFLVFLLASVVSSKKFAERWVISTCDFCVLFDVYRQNLHSTQVGDNQADTSNKVLVIMAKIPKKASH